MGAFDEMNPFVEFFRKEMRKRLLKLQQEVAKETGLYLIRYSVPSITSLEVFHFRNSQPPVVERSYLENLEVVERMIKSSLLLTKKPESRSLELYFGGFEKNVETAIPDTWFFFLDRYLAITSDITTDVWETIDLPCNRAPAFCNTFRNLLTFLEKLTIRDWFDVIVSTAFAAVFRSIDLPTYIEKYQSEALKFFVELREELEENNKIVVEVLSEKDLDFAKRVWREIQRQFPKRLPEEREFLDFVRKRTVYVIMVSKGRVKSITNPLCEYTYDLSSLQISVKDLIGLLKKHDLVKKITGTLERIVLKPNIRSFDDLTVLRRVFLFGVEIDTLCWLAYAHGILKEKPKGLSTMFLKVADYCFKRRAAALASRIEQKYENIEMQLHFASADERKKIIRKCLVIPASYAEKFSSDRFFNFLLTLLFVV